jgi:hypothetical protein
MYIFKPTLCLKVLFLGYLFLILNNERREALAKRGVIAGIRLRGM